MDTENIPRGIASQLDVGIEYQRIIDSSAGGKLQIEFSKRLVQLTDITHPDFFFKAEIRGNGKLRFEVKSKDTQGKYHPDLSASDLYRMAIKHFRALGVNVSQVVSVWTHEEGLNDNFLAYQDPAISLARKEAKVLKTPEGKVLSNLGYKPTSVDDANKNEVIVQWTANNN